jgi:hypothetical protein
MTLASVARGFTAGQPGAQLRAKKRKAQRGP